MSHSDDALSHDGLDSTEQLGSDEALDDEPISGGERGSFNDSRNESDDEQRDALTGLSTDNLDETINVSLPQHRPGGNDWKDRDCQHLDKNEQEEISKLQNFPPEQQLTKFAALWQKTADASAAKPRLMLFFDHATACELEDHLWAKLELDHADKKRTGLNQQGFWLLELYAELGVTAAKSAKILERVCDLLCKGCPWDFLMTSVRHHKGDRHVRVKDIKSTETLWANFLDTEGGADAWQAALQTHGTACAAMKTLVWSRRPTDTLAVSNSATAYRACSKRGRSIELPSSGSTDLSDKRAKLSGVAVNDVPIHESGLIDDVSMPGDSRTALGEQLLSTASNSTAQTHEAARLQTYNLPANARDNEVTAYTDCFLSYNFKGDLSFPIVHFTLSVLSTMSHRIRILDPRVISNGTNMSKIAEEELIGRYFIVTVRDPERRWLAGFLDLQNRKIEVFDPANANVATEKWIEMFPTSCGDLERKTSRAPQPCINIDSAINCIAAVVVALCRYRQDESRNEKNARKEHFKDSELINVSVWRIYLPFLCNLLRPSFHINPNGMTNFTWTEIGSVFDHWCGIPDLLRPPMPTMNHGDASQRLHGALATNVESLQFLTERYVHWKQLDLGLVQLSNVISNFVDICALRRALERQRRGVLMEMIQCESDEDDRRTNSLASRLAAIECQLGPEGFYAVGTQMQADEFTAAIGAARDEVNACCNAAKDRLLTQIQDLSSFAESELRTQ